MFTIKIDSNIKLQLLHLNQADALFALTQKNRNEFIKWMPWVEDTKSIEDTKAFIVNSLKNYAQGREINCSIVYNGTIVGNISLFGINNGFNIKKAEIGYWLDGDYQGKGIMTKAVKKIIDIAFNELDIYKVVIKCATTNYKSCKIPKKLGFTLEGTVRCGAKINGVICDFNYFGVLKDEWEKS
jgi:ribosomal-protein-serine acetyltransferase